MNLSELKEKYVTEIDLKYKSDQTKLSYINCFNKFIKENSRVYRMSYNDLKEYMSNFRRKYSDSYFNVMGSSLIILYRDVLKQPHKMNWFKPIKIKRKYHDIITCDEFVSMMRNTDNLKHKTIIILLYSTGVRESELLNIKLTDIKGDCIFIRSLKNGKNRNVQLHSLAKRYVQKYIRMYSPNEYLFNGQKSDRYSAASVRNIVKRVSNGSAYPHLLRHTYISNVIEKESVFFAQEQAGHESLESTLFYNHIPSDKLRTAYNPLDAVAV